MGGCTSGVESFLWAQVVEMMICAMTSVETIDKGDDDLCNEKDLNNRWGQVRRSGSHGSVNIEGNFCTI